MQIDINEQKQIPLLKRTELTARVTFEGSTPSRDDVCKALAKKVKADTSLMVISKIDTDFGSPGAKVTAQVYDDKEAMEAFAPKMGKKAKEKIEAAKKAEEDSKKKAAEEKKATEAPKEEPPAEEKKEEPAEKAEEAKEGE